MTITGYIYDATTGMPIPAATITVLKNNTPTGEGTVGDSEGNFTVSVSDPANSTIRATSIGYKTAVTSPYEASEISLFPSDTQLPGVTISAQTPAKQAINWKPILIGVAAAFVLGYLINESHEHDRRKRMKR